MQGRSGRRTCGADPHPEPPRGDRSMSTGADPTPDDEAVTGPVPGPWSYDTAFARHRGLISAEEQGRLRRSRVAIVGMGGVGGIHLVTLARLGIGGFHV